MRLTEQDIRNFTVGAVNITYENDEYHFFKCTEKQITYFDKIDNGYSRRVRTTTGIRIDFHTSSDYIAFEAINGGKYELYIDGLLVKQFKITEKSRLEFNIKDSFDNIKKEHRLTIILPSHSIGAISYIEVSDDATIQKHEYDKKVLFIGDSITQGWDTYLDSFSFAYKLSFFLNANSIIQGIGGACFSEESFDIFDFEPDMVFVALGTNDFNLFDTLEELESNADANLYSISQAHKGSKLYYISPIWRQSQNERMGNFSSARETLIKTAEKNGFLHIDGFSLVPNLPEFYIEDLLHPNILGYTQYAENLIRILLKKYTNIDY